ncbi:MAG: VCBS repeat-containing protein, partial [Bacteroidota bacterium]
MPSYSQIELNRYNVAFKSMDGTAIKDPLFGGFNSPQFSSIDLNRDGIKDLFVFDRIGEKVKTFINQGGNGINYTYAPEYESIFPNLYSFAILRDFNQDGIEDIFTSSINRGPVGSGMLVMEGFIEEGNLQFRRFQHQPWTANVISVPSINGQRTNMEIPFTDIPAVDDIDGDGDLDVVVALENDHTVAWVENIGGLFDSTNIQKIDDHEDSYAVYAV